MDDRAPYEFLTWPEVNMPRSELWGSSSSSYESTDPLPVRGRGLWFGQDGVNEFLTI